MTSNDLIYFIKGFLHDKKTLSSKEVDFLRKKLDEIITNMQTQVSFPIVKDAQPLNPIWINKEGPSCTIAGTALLNQEITKSISAPLETLNPPLPNKEEDSH